MDKIKYIGATSPWRDDLTGSGLTWTTGQEANVADHIGNVARGYTSHFQLVDDGVKVTADSSGALYRDDTQSPVSGGSTGVGFARTAVVIGDSLVDNGDRVFSISGGAGTQYEVTNRAFVDLANAMAGKPFEVLNRAGIGGQTLAQIRDRFATDVAAYKPNTTFLVGMTNDLDASRSVSVMWEDILAMLTACKTWGGELVFLGQTAMARGNVANSARSELFRIARNYMGEDPAFSFVDIFGVGVDWTLTVADAAAGTPRAADLAGDATHPSSSGAYKAARAIAAWMQTRAYARYQHRAFPRRNASAGETWIAPSGPPGASDGDGTVVNTNGLMLGSGGVAATGFTGSVPDQHKVQRTGGGATVTGAVSVVPYTSRTDGRSGNLIRVASCTGFANLTTDFVSINNDASGTTYSGNQGSLALAVGKQIKMLAYVNVACSVGTIFGIWCDLQIFSTDGTTVIARAAGPIAMDGTTPAHSLGATSFEGVIESAAITIPAGAAKFSARVVYQGNIGSTAQVDVGNFEVPVY